MAPIHPAGRWRQIESAYHAARARPAAERAAFLAAVCDGDEPLRREIESLLDQPVSADGLLETPIVFAGQSTPGRPAASLTAQRVGAYQVLMPLGIGGMGEVYRARDTRLGRDVAIKILPAAFKDDSERLARFDREARLLASLNHPHIAAIYGLEDSDAGTALVMELVEGDDLSQRIARGALTIDAALKIARQIADALAAAHEQGIIHRDLKPANVKVRPDGAVKVLDFGLAKAMSSTAAAAALVSPTITNPDALTGGGVILGTAAYMSPEQATGREADRRSDVWAFGVVLYEMVTGQRPFTGDGVSDTLASVLSQQPDWTALPSTTPPLIRRLLRRCLEKDRSRRLADIADAGLDIDDALSGAETDTTVPASTSRTRERLTWTAALVLVGLTATAILARPPRSVLVSPEPTRTLLSVAPTEQSVGVNPLEERPGAARPTRTAVALSPDGKTLVFGAIWGGEPQLYARPMDELSATVLPGTTGGNSPFFSPDGQWVGFWAAGELRTVPLSGGPSVTLCKAAALFGASWADDGTIVFATSRNGGLRRVPAAGGTPEPLTTLRPGEYSHRLPYMLPGSHAVIFTISKGANLWDDTQIVVRSLETGKQTVLVVGGSDGRYVSTGHLVYVRLGKLMAIPFDPVRLAVIGDAKGVMDGVMQAANRNLSDMENSLAAQFTVSESGALVYLTGGAVAGAARALAWVDAKGTGQALPGAPRPYFVPRLSPDGQHLTVSTRDDIRKVWSVDIARGALSPITTDGESNYSVFAPDGKRVVFRSGAAGGEDNLYWKAADGSGDAERLTTSARSQTPGSWSPDGTTIAFVEEGDTPAQSFFQFDIWVLSIGDRTTHPVIQTPANEVAPEFSPDGRWLAYVSNQSGRHEVYVQPYPGPGERHLISTSGGDQPAWNRNGREVFYVQSGPSGSRTLMSVSIRTAPTFRAGTPHAVFDSADLGSAWGRSYDVAPDGRRFLLTVNKELPTSLPPARMIVVQNWFDELKRLVPTP